LPRDVRERISGAGHDRFDRRLDRMPVAEGLDAVFED